MQPWHILLLRESSAHLLPPWVYMFLSDSMVLSDHMISIIFNLQQKGVSSTTIKHQMHNWGFLFYKVIFTANYNVFKNKSRTKLDLHPPSLVFKDYFCCCNDWFHRSYCFEFSKHFSSLSTKRHFTAFAWNA